jgi:hypothetical protein
MSACIAHDPTTSADGKPSSSTSTPSISSSSPPPSRHSLFRRGGVFQRARAHSAAEMPDTATTETAAPPEIAPDQDVQIAVVVAMPAQSYRHEQIPEILIGTSTTPVRGES